MLFYSFFCADYLPPRLGVCLFVVMVYFLLVVFLKIGTNDAVKPSITISIAKNLVDEKGLNAGNIVKEIAKHINGGGGGQAFLATAGG